MKETPKLSRGGGSDGGNRPSEERTVGKDRGKEKWVNLSKTTTQKGNDQKRDQSHNLRGKGRRECEMKGERGKEGNITERMRR